MMGVGTGTFDPPTHPPIPSTHPTMYSSFRPSTFHPSTHPPTHVSILPLIHLFSSYLTLLFVYALVSPSTHPPTHPPTHPLPLPNKGEKGAVHVTDMDRIEKSNLSRQFLFRANDIGTSFPPTHQPTHPPTHTYLLIHCRVSASSSTSSFFLCPCSHNVADQKKIRTNSGWMIRIRVFSFLFWPPHVFASTQGRTWVLLDTQPPTHPPTR